MYISADCLMENSHSRFHGFFFIFGIEKRLMKNARGAAGQILITLLMISYNVRTFSQHLQPRLLLGLKRQSCTCVLFGRRAFTFIRIYIRFARMYTVY